MECHGVSGEMLDVALDRRKTLRSNNMIFEFCKQQQRTREEEKKQIYLAAALDLGSF
jgi:hypothetical protein